MRLADHFPHITKFKITARHAASAVAVAASVFSFSQLNNDQARQQRDLELSSGLLADSLRVAIEPLLAEGSTAKLRTLAKRFGKRGRLAGIAVYDPQGGVILASESLAPRLVPPPAAVRDCLARGAEADGYELIGGARMRVNALPLRGPRGPAGALAVFHDTGFIEARMARTRWNNARRMAIQASLFVTAVLVFGLFFK